MKSILILIVLLPSLLPAIRAQFNAILTQWIDTENTTALARIFANIGSAGQFVPDADPGAIVASPSTASPNYYFQVSPILWRVLIGSGCVIRL